MIFEDNNRTYDTDNIAEGDEKYFERLMQYKYHEIESIVNPRRCINLTPETIQSRVTAMLESITAAVCLTEEQITFVLDHKKTNEN